MSWNTLLGILFITIGGTLLGSLPVLFHRLLTSSHWRWSESFCGGVMISASVFSLFIPAWEILKNEGASLWTMIHGSSLGMVFVLLSHAVLLKLTRGHRHRRAYLFVLAMGIHNVPEGLAVGVDVAALGWNEAMPLGIAIFIQNLPEGLVSSLTFLISGFSVSSSLFANAITAVIEGGSALLGFTSVEKVGLGLSFLLSFSGACMSTVVAVEAVEKWKEGGAASFSLSGAVVGLMVCAALDLFL